MASIELFGNWWGYNDYNEVFHEGETSPTANASGARTAIYNCSGKTIKYLTFGYTPFNSVNDKCDDTKYGKLTGPIEPNSGASVFFEHLWFNPTVTDVKIESIKIEYADGSTENVKGTEITHILTPEAEKYHTSVFNRFHNLSEIGYKTYFMSQENAKAYTLPAIAWRFNEKSSFYEKYKEDFKQSAEIGMKEAKKATRKTYIILGAVAAVVVIFSLIQLFLSI